MNTSIVFAVVCALSSVACDLSCLGDCEWSDDECSDQHEGRGGRANASGGKSPTGNELGGASSGDTGGTGNSAGKGGDSTPPSKACSEESDCPRGFNCDYERQECVAAEAETCPELSSESSCDNRKDCMSIYAGINCSCGPECTCVGGEPGCVCESFKFFSCEALKD